MPMTPFIGVRISWLMLARNSDLSRTDSKAASRACSSSAAIWLRSVMSRLMPIMPTILPCRSRYGPLVVR